MRGADAMLLRDHSCDLVWFDTLIGIRAQRGPSTPDRWNPQHVDSLPADIRNAVTRMCGQAPKAERDFTSYFENSRRIVLHFQHFRCDGRPLCTKAGCLQQVYTFTGGHYRLLKSYYGPAGE
jgi:hypothetical protein